MNIINENYFCAQNFLIAKQKVVLNIPYTIQSKQQEDFFQYENNSVTLSNSNNIEN